MPARSRDHHAYEKNETNVESTRDRIKPPSHRHAAPSAPWPWVDIEDIIDIDELSGEKSSIPKPCDHMMCDRCWQRYPKSLFPNWTPRQVEKSLIDGASKVISNSVLYYVDVDSHGFFHSRSSLVSTKEANLDEVWYEIRKDRPKLIDDDTHQLVRHEDMRVRAIFIQDMSGPVMQMLGTRYNIEPFFFSSSLNWIPSRYEEEVQPGVGDHITISLTFIRSLPKGLATNLSSELPGERRSSVTLTDGKPGSGGVVWWMGAAHAPIDTQAPLDLASVGRQLVLDLLSVHFIRKSTGSTIISYHPSLALRTTSADYLHKRIRFAGQSVYWQTIFRQSKDPTFVLLTFIWHALYSWDEALENLYSHICNMESQVINTTELQMNLTRELHIIRAHHLHYSSLLEDFKKTVVFIRDTKNPAMHNLPPEEKQFSRDMMVRECANLLSEIDRLENSRRMQDKRLKNVMNLVSGFECWWSLGMKQIAYLTMFFLPASFVAAVFGMNVGEIAPDTNGTLPHYVETALPLTIATIWIIIAFQSQDIYPKRVPYWQRFFWPFVLILKWAGWDIYKEDIRREREEAAMGILGVEHHRLGHYVPKKRKKAAAAPKEEEKQANMPQVLVMQPGLPTLMVDHAI
ncbi:hypothetical protein CVT24_007521 [Panaeolus cyanescens]|uniref:Uncharacterized protein n=1 Tax=Panaeolus cyanescens TaxID=181874 RepID=A0A409W9W7_9AGAR|nr:hypothetical protein CVT24_007521 [Panaeolus cyanescens]